MAGGRRRRVCFVTGTRAEFGLMRSTLAAVAGHPRLELQIVATGMHLDRAHGRTLDGIRRQGWTVNATVSWPRAATPAASAARTGSAMAGLADAYEKLESDVVLVVGDRVEAFAAASAAHISGRVVAHVHGGDRALGQVDDALRHAVTKLAHVHFAATPASARRVRRLGEDGWRVHTVGAPGIDGITAQAATWDEVGAECAGLRQNRYALLVLHPTAPDDAAEARAADLVLRATLASGLERVVVVAPNNDPGAAGILRRWDALADPRVMFRRDLNRGMFLGFLRDAAVLVGNSSSGIIEAASLGTPVVDIGPRQAGRERSRNVVNVPLHAGKILQAVQAAWRGGRPVRYRGRNVYGGDGAGERIASILARLSVDDRLRRKLIAY